MTDDPKDTAAETPMERALRLKKAALEAKPKRPGDGKFPSPQGAGMTSKPAMRR